MSGLSVSAPSSLTFADADQPISLYDYDPANLFYHTYPLVADAVITSGTPTDTTVNAQNGINLNGTGATELAYILLDATTVPLFVSAWVELDAGGVPADTTHFHFTINGSVGSVTWDTPTLVTGNVYLFEGTCLQGHASASAGFVQTGAQATAAGGGVSFSKLEVRPYSSDKTGATIVNTGTPGTLTASYGDIQFADAQYNVAVDAYRLTITVGSSGTIDFDNTAYAAVTENAGGDGTGTIDVTGTLAQLNALFLPTSPAIAGFASETSSISGIIRHVASGRLETFNISVTSTAAATFLLLSDATSYLLLSDGTSKLKLSK